MIKLIRNADVYAPAHLGQKDVLVIADKVVRIADKIEGYEGMPEVEVFDFSGKKLLPGYIDMHMHITGGGGEQGPASRVPEAMLSPDYQLRYYNRSGPAGYRRCNQKRRKPGS